MSVAKRFESFLTNITLKEAQIDAGKERRNSVVRILNLNYYGLYSDTANSKFVGSWGKFTRIRPPRDVDLLFILPFSKYESSQYKSGNKQSQLLQEIRLLLLKTFPNTDIRGDGPVVKVPFSAYDVELIPAFKLQTGRYWICMTKNGGEYKVADYEEEFAFIKNSNDITKNMTRDLIRMMKCWQGYCSVPLKSFWIEITAVNFLSTWSHSGKSKMYYDYMVRDYLNYLRNQENGFVFAPGTNEFMALGNLWISKVNSAYQRAEKACTLEASDALSAGDEWQKIFGADIPKHV